MKKSILKTTIGTLVLLMGLLVISCSSDDETSPEEVDTSSHIFKAELLNSANLLSSVTLVDATLTDGTTAQCYKLVFKSNPVEDGPYCPETINDIGGIGIYDGATNPGLQVLKATLWNAMEADGYDIVDTNGNINYNDPGSGVMPSGPSCLGATPNNNLELTYLIPAIPKTGTSVDQINVVENVGVSYNGIPLTGNPPSVVNGPPGMGGPPGMSGGNIPSIDPCGGHIDPFGYYHLHFAPSEMNNVLEAHDISDVSCTNFTQSEIAFVGFAKDGYPMYASKDENGTLPSDLDECQGHTAPTADYPEGVYHYHASNSSAPNFPTCLKGVSAEDSLTYQ